MSLDPPPDYVQQFHLRFVAAQRQCDKTTQALANAKHKLAVYTGVWHSDLGAEVARLQRIGVSAKRRLHSTSQDYARVLVQPYTTRLFRRLPRELRDIIYSYMGIQSPPTDVYLCSSDPRKIYFTHEERFAGCWHEYEWEIGYLGNEVIADLAVPWYCTYKFILGKERYGSNNGCPLNQFLAEDFWRVGLRPSELVQNLDIHIDDYYFDDIMTLRVPRPPGSPLAHELRQDFSMGLRHLTTARPINGHISLTLYTEDLGVASEEGNYRPILETGLTMLLPTLGELQKNGWKIRLDLTGALNRTSGRLYSWLNSIDDAGECTVHRWLAIIKSLVQADVDRDMISQGWAPVSRQGALLDSLVPDWV